MILQSQKCQSHETIMYAPPQIMLTIESRIGKQSLSTQSILFKAYVFSKPILNSTPSCTPLKYTRPTKISGAIKVDVLYLVTLVVCCLILLKFVMLKFMLICNCI